MLVVSYGMFYIFNQKLNTMTNTEKLGIAMKALEKMADPIGAMQKEAKSEGYGINGAMLVQIAGDGEFYKKLAKDTLAEINS